MLVMFRQVDLKRASGPRGRRLVVLGRGYNVGAMLGRGSSFVGGGCGNCRPRSTAPTSISPQGSGCDVVSPTACAATIHTTRWAQKTAWEASAHALEAESTGSVRNQAESGVAGGKTRAKTTAREGPSQRGQHEII